MPPITSGRVYSRVARVTECLEIRLITRATFRKREHVVYLRGFGVAAMLHALLAERMSSYVSVSYLLPASIVAVLRLRVTFVLLVLLIDESFVLLTVASVRKLGAAGVGARTLRFKRHVNQLH